VTPSLEVLVAATLVLAVAAWLQYGPIIGAAEILARRLAPSLPQAATYPIDHVRAIVGLPAFGVLGMVSYVVACAATGLSPLSPLAGATPELVALGALLGVAEAGVALVFASTAIAGFAPLRLRGMRDDQIASEMRIVGRSGWIRLYDHVMRMRPLPLSIAVVMIPLMAEELVFRGLGVTLLRPFGPGVAIGLTTAFFILAQAPKMPSWFSALPAACGALVVGLVHASLFWAEPSLAPLFVAHLTFFLFVAL